MARIDRDLFGRPVIPPKAPKRAPPTRRAAYARSSDPDTSHEAAHRISYSVSRLEAEVMRVLKEHGTWMSVIAIAAACDKDKWCISPRMKPLDEEAGLIDRKKMPGLNSVGKIRPLLHARIRPSKP